MCPESAQTVMIVCIIIVVLLIILLFAFGGGNGGSSSITIALSGLQVLAVLGSVNMRFPEEVRAIFNLMSFINLNLDVASPECTVEMGYYLKWYATLLVPFAFCGIYIVLGILYVIMKACIGHLTLKEALGR